jgi:hypothetical protein
MKILIPAAAATAPSKIFAGPPRPSSSARQAFEDLFKK